MTNPGRQPHVCRSALFPLFYARSVCSTFAVRQRGHYTTTPHRTRFTSRVSAEVLIQLALLASEIRLQCRCSENAEVLIFARCHAPRPCNVRAAPSSNLADAFRVAQSLGSNSVHIVEARRAVGEALCAEGRFQQGT